MRLFLSFATLFLSVVLLQLGLGGVAVLDAISGVGLGFSTAQIGLLGSAHFFGFFIGCWWAPRLMGTVGHSRAFAAFTAAGTIGILAHMLVIDAYAWAVMRMAAGLSVAGCYTIIEAWMQGRVTNATRGRAMGVYRVVDIAGSLGAQTMIAVLEPGSYVSYNLLALICCCAIFPLTLTRAEAPETPDAPRLRPRLAWERSPLGAVGVVVSGVTGAAFRMVGPVYGLQVGLAPDQIALFLAAYVLGGAVAQVPVGWLADRYDRRSVLMGLSVAAVAACAATIFLAGMGPVAVFLTAGAFGFTTLPIYSVSTAHAHDFAASHERVELSAAHMFLYAVGAIASPLAASLVIAWLGPAAMFLMIALSHLALIGFGIVRMRARPAAGAVRTAYTYEPRTSFLIGRLLGMGREGTATVGSPAAWWAAGKAWARSVKRDVVALWIAARDPRTPLAARFVAAAVAAYALSPIDLIPDFIPVLGYLDDVVIVPLGILLALRMIPPPLLAEFRATAALREGRPVSRTGLMAIVALWVAAAAALTWWLARAFAS